MQKLPVIERKYHKNVLFFFEKKKNWMPSINKNVLNVFCFVFLEVLFLQYLRNLVSFLQIKKRKKHPWRSVTFSN